MSTLRPIERIFKTGHTSYLGEIQIPLSSHEEVTFEVLGGDQACFWFPPSVLERGYLMLPLSSIDRLLLEAKELVNAHR